MATEQSDLVIWLWTKGQDRLFAEGGYCVCVCVCWKRSAGGGGGGVGERLAMEGAGFALQWKIIS